MNLKLVAAGLVVALGGCSGGAGGVPPGSDGSTPNDAGAADAAGAADDAAGGGDGGGQQLPPYKGRIVVTPAALLFTKTGDTAVLHPQAFDASGQPLDVAFTFSSSQPDQVSVDDSGNVQALVDLGWTQITVTGGDLASPPLLVLVAQPPDGAVLVADAQVVTDPAPVDPSAELAPGAQVKVTLDGVADLAPGTMVLAREGKGVAGKVVSTQPNGSHTDVVLELVPLLDMFKRLSFDAGYDMDLQTVADAQAIAAQEGAAGASSGAGSAPPAVLRDFDMGPLTCNASVDPTGVSVEQSLTFTPKLHLRAAFKKDDNGDWTEAALVLTGNLQATGKVSVKLNPGAIASLSCKWQFVELIVPVAGPLSVVVAPRIPVGVKFKIKAQALTASLEFGGKVEQSADFALGFDSGVQGTGDVGSVTIGDPHFEPIAKVNSDPTPGVEVSLAAGPFAGLNLSLAKLKLAEAFGGAQLKYQLKPLDFELGDPSFANKYELYAPYWEIGPGSDLAKVLKYFGGLVSFKLQISDTGLLISRSPYGTFTVDKSELAAGDTLHATITLNDSALTFLGIANVGGAHIYRYDPGSNTPHEVASLSGAGPTYAWTWTPGPADVGQYIFAAAVDDRILSLLGPVLGVTFPPFEVEDDSNRSVHVGPKQAGWSGTVNLTWSGSGPTSDGGNFTESGSETITYVPDTSQPTDGVNFGLDAQSVLFDLTYDSTSPTTTLPDGCTSQRTYHATGSIDRPGTVQDTTLLQIMPNGDYLFPIVGLGVDAAYTDTTTLAGCADAQTMVATGTAPFGVDGAPATGSVQPAATSFSGSTSYTSADGTITYNANWSFNRQ